MTKSTKIVATLGPATESEEQIEKLLEAGMNIARFNTKHSEPAWHNEVILKVKAVAERLKKPVGILLDLQGPEVRINLPNEQPFDIKKGEEALFTCDFSATTPRTIYVPENVITSLQVGNEIILEDGACEFKVTQKEPNLFRAEAMIDCTVKHRKTMNTPGVVLEMPSLTERDFQYLDTVKPENVDFVGLSFVRNKEDIEILRKELTYRHYSAHIIAKIENQNAVDNLDEICEVADGVMVARGDLGVEVPFQELTYWQKIIINKCRLLAKPVITATEMLKSMVNNPRPTRAEVSDVAHAIYDGTDAVMLSEETTIGKYAVKSVATQALIAEYNEQHAELKMESICSDDSTISITQAAMDILENSNLPIDKIICLTQTGKTAQLISRFRPHIPIIAVTPDVQTCNRLNLSYGVNPIQMNRSDNETWTEDSFLEQLKSRDITSSGEYILLVRGKFWYKSGLTNTVSVIHV